jgi:hypothetical protein
MAKIRSLGWSIAEAPHQVVEHVLQLALILVHGLLGIFVALLQLTLDLLFGVMLPINNYLQLEQCCSTVFAKILQFSPARKL